MTTIPDYQVVPEEKAAEILDISVSTLRRQHAKGKGPPRVQLSDRRYGYMFGKLIAWANARTEQPTTA